MVIKRQLDDKIHFKNMKTSETGIKLDDQGRIFELVLYRRKENRWIQRLQNIYKRSNEKLHLSNGMPYRPYKE